MTTNERWRPINPRPTPEGFLRFDEAVVGDLGHHNAGVEPLHPTRREMASRLEAYCQRVGPSFHLAFFGGEVNSFTPR